MMYSEKMEPPVLGQKPQTFVNPPPTFVCLPGGLGKTYHHVSQSHHPIRPWLFIERETQNIRRPKLSHVFSVELSHLFVVNQAHRNLDITGQTVAFDHPGDRLLQQFFFDPVA